MSTKKNITKTTEQIIAEVITSKMQLANNSTFSEKLVGLIKQFNLSADQKIKVEIVQDPEQLKDILMLNKYEWRNDKGEVTRTGTTDKGAIVALNEVTGEDPLFAFGLKTTVHKRIPNNGIKLPKALLKLGGELHNEEEITSGTLITPNECALILKTTYNQQGSFTTLYCFNLQMLILERATGEKAEDNLLHLAQKLAKDAGKHNVKYILSVLNDIHEKYRIGDYKLKVKSFKYDEADAFDQIVTNKKGHRILQVEQLYLEEGEKPDMKLGYSKLVKTEDGKFKTEVCQPAYDDHKSFIVLVMEETKYGFTYYLNAYNI